jgi:small subunit ribosomal protein S8
MMVNDPIGDMLTRMRNAQQAGKAKVSVPYSKFRTSVLDVLKNEGYISNYSVSDIRKGLKDISVTLKYVDTLPVITTIKRVSKPGRRVYAPVTDLGMVHSGLGIKILSTSRGILSDAEARSAGVGGEIVCEVF